MCGSKQLLMAHIIIVIVSSASCPPFIFLSTAHSLLITSRISSASPSPPPPLLWCDLLLSPPFPFHSPFFSTSLPVAHFTQCRCLGERCKFSQRGSGRSPGRQSIHNIFNCLKLSGDKWFTCFLLLSIPIDKSDGNKGRIGPWTLFNGNGRDWDW